MSIIDRIDSYSKYEKEAQIYDKKILTYKELKYKSDALACYLIEKYEKNKKPILVYGHKEEEMLICFLACTKAGHPYVPIDITFPETRVKDVIENCNANLIFHIEDREIELPKTIGKLDKQEINNIFSLYNGKIPDKDFEVNGEEIYYILYTSGSTGKPKGVKITYNCLENFLNWFEKEANLQDISLDYMNQVSYSFDVSVIGMYIGLSLGRRLFVIDKKMIENFQELFLNLGQSNIGFIATTPAFIQMCLVDENFNETLLPNLKKVVVAGEVLTKQLAMKFYERFPKVKLINGYGPTESTVLVTSVEISKEMIESKESLPIGYSGENIHIKILDKMGKEVTEGNIGEIVIYGDSVSTGYYNNESMTKKVFFNTKLNGTQRRAYKTGDLGYKKNQLFYYKGREDFQIKLNGFRIELQDIEENLCSIEFVENAVVIPVKKNEKINHLTAFITLNKDMEESGLKLAKKVKEELKTKIPEYMIPRQIKVKERFVLNVNGKIDRKVLMEELGC
ncbi:D-alanine--poly(phosphoribitol) ligase subunit DltA [Clostridiaceae bacterium 14S0207]|nr:D-alanine--poly(phosphoribitol) ligase subunit DltA [Clostridiaceae bacterium 14S0207]